MAELSETPPKRRFLLECSGACGDLGTFIPHVIGAMTVAGLAPARVLFGFAAFLIATGLLYGLPLPVQPMKAISAVILTGGLRPGEVAAAGMMIGVVLLILGITGWIGRLARAIPQSVSAGLQLGLGLLMAMLGLKLLHFLRPMPHLLGQSIQLSINLDAFLLKYCKLAGQHHSQLRPHLIA